MQRTLDLPKGIEKKLDILIAVGLYKSKNEVIKTATRKLLGRYKNYIKPIDKVKEQLAMEIPADVELSEEIIKMRRKEMEPGD
jgi:Arc/MetJ-type ribon-helix-helix transcriptional regulator